VQLATATASPACRVALLRAMRLDPWRTSFILGTGSRANLAFGNVFLLSGNGSEDMGVHLVERLVHEWRGQTGFIFGPTKDENRALAARLRRTGHAALAYYSETAEDRQVAHAAHEAVAADPTHRRDFPEEYMLSMRDILERWMRTEVHVLVSTIVLSVSVDHK